MNLQVGGGKALDGVYAGRKVFALQAAAGYEAELPSGATLAKVVGFSLHAGVAAKAHDRDKRERLGRTISGPAVSAPRLCLTWRGNIRFHLKTPYPPGSQGRSQ